MAHTHKKELNFELNLLPILSVMSICICFLLTSTVWTRMGLLEIHQSVGDVIPESGMNPKTLWVKIGPKKTFEIETKSEDGSPLSSKVITASITELNQQIYKLIQSMPLIKVALVFPNENANYGEVIKILDILKSYKLDVGVSP